MADFAKLSTLVPEHPNFVAASAARALTLKGVASPFVQADYDAADQTARKALAALEERYNTDHPDGPMFGGQF